MNEAKQMISGSAFGRDGQQFNNIIPLVINIIIVIFNEWIE
jgi:hypothetical protein